MKAALVVLALCGVAYAEPRPARAAYIAELLEAVRGLDHATLVNLHKYLQVVERNKCQAPEMTLRVGCLLEAAGQNCKQLPGDVRQRCARASDVMVTNLLAERVFVPDDVRFELMTRQRDARSAIARELHRRHAALVAELTMSDGFPGPRADAAAFATGIDGFCTGVAGTRDLSWQYCVAAIVWFVARDGAAEETR